MNKNQQKIEKYRAKIDTIDSGILNLLAKRFRLCEKIAEYKHHEEIPIKQEKREQEVLENRQRRGEEAGLKKEFVKLLFKIILKQSRIHQKDQPTALTKRRKIDKIV